MIDPNKTPELCRLRWRLDSACPVDRPESPLWDLVGALDSAVEHDLPRLEEIILDESEDVAKVAFDQFRAALKPWHIGGDLSGLRTAWVDAIPKDLDDMDPFDGQDCRKKIEAAERDAIELISKKAVQKEVDRFTDNTRGSGYLEIDNLIRGVLSDLQQHGAPGFATYDAITELRVELSRRHDENDAE